MAVDLDDVDLARADPGGMLATVEASPAQWAAAVEAGRSAPVPEIDPARLRAVVVAGMGGSGVSADVAAAVAERCGEVPVLAVKDHRVGAAVGPDTLVVGVSHSGATEETIAVLRAAGDAGAPRLAVAGGGAVAEMARGAGFPLVEVPVPDAPEAARMPRANLANLVAPLLAVLDRAGVLRGAVDALAPVPDELDELSGPWRHEVPAADNPVKQAALALEHQVPVFYGARGLPAVAARRAKCQVNENAKRPAFHGELPELDHNEVAGWTALPELSARFTLVELRSPPDEHPQVARRFAATRELVGDRTGGVVSVEARGSNALVRFAAAALFVDLLSVHLALLSGQDPTPIEAIVALKQRLATGPRDDR